MYSIKPTNSQNIFSVLNGVTVIQMKNEKFEYWFSIFYPQTCGSLYENMICPTPCVQKQTLLYLSDTYQIHAGVTREQYLTL